MPVWNWPESVLEDFDIAEFLHLLTRRASELLDVAEVGILLVSGGTPQVMASSTERARNVELFQRGPRGGVGLDGTLAGFQRGTGESCAGWAR